MANEPRVPEIIGVGSPIIDYTVEVNEKFVEIIPGRKAGMELVDHPTIAKILAETGGIALPMLGGSSANTIRGLATFGHYCAFIGKIGKDPTGDHFVKGLTALGVKTTYLLPTEIPTSQVICLITPDKERTMRAFLGASRELNVGDIRKEMFSDAKIVHFEGYMLLNQPVAEKAMELAKEAGAKVSLDLGSFEIVEGHQDKIVEYLSNYVDIVFANRDEIWSLAQMTPEKACSVLRDIVDIAVVLLDAEGCMVGHREQLIQVPAYPAKDIIDTTGAGDLFVSGFLHGYLRGKDLEESARYGTIAGATIIQRRGVDVQGIIL